jgi:hypothetical protein
MTFRAQRTGGHLGGGWTASSLIWGGSGTPYSVLNGFDRNNDGIPADRPDIGNPDAPLNTRAIMFINCPTGWLNPDTNSCVTPSDVHFIMGMDLPNSDTMGRNTLTAEGSVEVWMSVLKSFIFKGDKKLELGIDIWNVFNDPGYTGIPIAYVFGSPASYFLNKAYLNSNIRRMSVRARIIF